MCVSRAVNAENVARNTTWVKACAEAAPRAYHSPRAATSNSADCEKHVKSDPIYRNCDRAQVESKQELEMPKLTLHGAVGDDGSECFAYHGFSHIMGSFFFFLK